MNNDKRAVLGTAVTVAVLLSACAPGTDPSVTRAWQADSRIANLDDECRYDILSRNVLAALERGADEEDIYNELLRECPELQGMSFSDAGVMIDGLRAGAEQDVALFETGGGSRGSEGRSNNRESASPEGGNGGPGGSGGGNPSPGGGGGGLIE